MGEGGIRRRRRVPVPVGGSSSKTPPPSIPGPSSPPPPPPPRLAAMRGKAKRGRGREEATSGQIPSRNGREEGGGEGGVTAGVFLVFWSWSRSVGCMVPPPPLRP